MIGSARFAVIMLLLATGMPGPAGADDDADFQNGQLQNWTPQRQIANAQLNSLVYRAYDCIQALQQVYLSLGNTDRNYLINEPIKTCGGGVAGWFDDHPETHDPRGQAALKFISSKALTNLLAGN